MANNDTDRTPPVRVDPFTVAQAFEDAEDAEDGLYVAGDRFLVSDKALDLFGDGIRDAFDAKSKA